MTRALVALGSNLGDRLGYLRVAIDGLRELGDVVAVSALFETAPVGGPEQDPFLNAAAVVETGLDPVAFLAGLHAIERRADRERRVRWGPRTLDLDLIAHGDARLDQDGITVPHPRAHDRRFVLAPAAEIAPDAILADGRPVSVALAATSGEGVQRWPGDWVSQDPGLGREAFAWVGGQVLLFAVWCVGAVGGFDLRNSVISWLGVIGALGGAAVLLAAATAMGPKISVSPQPAQGAGLVDRGIYGMVRHPMYTGVVLLLGGASAAVRSVRAMLVAVLIGGFFLLKARREEQALALVVPGYLDYRRSVPHRFVPGVL